MEQAHSDMKPSRVYIQAVRLVGGFVLAPLVAIIALALSHDAQRFMDEALAGRPGLLPFYLIFASAQAVILGVPAYFLLKNSVRPTITNAAVTGGIIAAAPWFILFAGSFQLTWPEGFEFIARLAASGILAGITFWMCVAWRNPDFDFQVEG